MTTNYEFLKEIQDPAVDPEMLDELYDSCWKVEVYTFSNQSDAKIAMQNARLAVEMALKIYYLKKIGDPGKKGIAELFTELEKTSDFKKYANTIRQVQDVGNRVAHGKKVRNWRTGSIKASENVYKVVSEVCLKLGYISKIAPYQETPNDTPVLQPAKEVQPQEMKKEELQVYFIVDSSIQMGSDLEIVNHAMPAVVRLSQNTAQKRNTQICVKQVIVTNGIEVRQSDSWTSLQPNGERNLSAVKEWMSKELKEESVFEKVIVFVTNEHAEKVSLPAENGGMIRIGLCLGASSKCLEQFVSLGDVEDHYGTVLNRIGLRFSYQDEKVFAQEMCSIVKSALLSAMQRLKTPYINIGLDTSQD